jgi:hypothetical protein
MKRILAATNITYPKGGVGRSKDCFVVNGSLVFQFGFCAGLTVLYSENLHERKALERWGQYLK